MDDEIQGLQMATTAQLISELMNRSHAMVLIHMPINAEDTGGITTYKTGLLVTCLGLATAATAIIQNDISAGARPGDFDAEDMK